jgi:hypothetical protein
VAFCVSWRYSVHRFDFIVSALVIPQIKWRGGAQPRPGIDP